MKWIGENSTLISAIVAMLTVLFSLATVIVILRQTHSQRYVQRETNAFARFFEYLRISIAYPSFSSGLRTDPKDIKAEEYERYRWYISFMLSSFESILDIVGRDKWWMETVRFNLLLHEKYLFSDERFMAYELFLFSKKMQDLIKSCKGQDLHLVISELRGAGLYA